MQSEWLAIVVCFVMFIIAWIKWTRKIVWFEGVICIGLPILVTLLMKFILLYSEQADSYIVTQYATRVSHTPESSGVNMVPVSNGKTTTLQARPYHYSAHWDVYYEYGGSSRTDQSYYVSAVNRWRSTKWPGTEGTAIFGLRTIGYRNPLIYSSRSRSYPKVIKADIANYGLQPYSNRTGKHLSILGVKAQNHAKADTELAHLNRNLGHMGRQVYLVVFKDQPEEASKLQEAMWKGGNYNEIVVTLSVSESNEIQWVRVFSCSPDSELLEELEQSLLADSHADMLKISGKVSSLLSNGWEVLNLEGMNIFDMSLSILSQIIIWIVALLSGAISICWSVKNDITCDNSPRHS